MAKLIAGLIILLGLTATIKTQSTCPAADDETTTTLRVVIEQLFVDITTRYFGDTAIGDDGFPLVDGNARYGLFELFEERYGSGTSTAEFMAGLLDVLGSSTSGRTNATDHLTAVIGLANRGDYESAREETLLLILTSLTEGGLVELDFNRLTEVEVTQINIILTPVFVTIRNSLTQVAFERYLNLAVGSTLALVMDTTGSMAAEIRAAQDRFINIIETTRGTVNQPLLYVLSPYNDPEHGPVTVTSSPQVITDAINALVASGGGDFPELAGIGIYNGLLASTRRSVLFHITDASTKDVELESQIIAVALIKKIRIINLMTQEVTEDAGGPFYNRLSRATGGLTTVIDRSDIESVTQLFTALTTQGQVIIAFNTFATAPQLVVPIDRTINTLTIRVAGVARVNGVSSVTVTQIQQDGTAINVDTEVLINSNGLYLINLQGVSAWSQGSQLQLDFGGNLEEGYSVEISGESVFGTIANVRKAQGEEFINVDQHMAGSQAMVEVNIFGDSTSVELTQVQLQAEDGTVIQELEVSRCRDDEYYTTVTFTVPTVRFFIVVIGRNAQGQVFRRSDPCAITPLNSNIAVQPIPDQVVQAGDSLQVSTFVSNDVGSTLNFNYAVSDAALYVTSNTPSNSDITDGSQQEVQININVPSTAEDGSVSRVTITASPNPATGDFVFTSFNIIVRNPSANRCSPLVSQRGGDVICSNGFEDGSVCRLSCQPGFRNNGVTESTCVEGTWTEDNLVCDEVGFATCQGTGDPHYTTFDGRYYDYMGTCVYTLVQSNLGNGTGLVDFDIQVENENRGGNTRVSWFKQAFVNINEFSANFRKGREVIINGLQVNLPFSLASSGINIELSGNQVVMTTRFGLTVRYDGNSVFKVELSGAYQGLVSGLCGDFDGNPDNDLRLPTDPETDVGINVFGDFFQSGGLSTRCQGGTDVDGDCEERETYEALCNIIDGECFAACREVIPTPEILRNCLFDMCITEGNLISYEQAVSDYANQCQLRGITICDWRNESDPPVVPECPPNSHYEAAGIACANTCRNRQAANRCTKPKVEGCFCDDGFVLSGDKCVPVSECGCTSNGKYYLNGESYLTDDCSFACSCENGDINCSENLCGEGETCQQQNGQTVCAPQEFASCQGAGDPHYVTFDGLRYDFQGACTYTLVQTAFFTLDVTNEYRNGVTRVSYLKDATLVFYHAVLDTNVRIDINREDGSSGQVFATGLYPQQNGEVIVYGYNDDVINIDASQRGVVIKLGSVTIEFKNTLIRVTVPGSLKNQVSGLCGNYNGETNDDFTDNNGTLVENANLFATSFQTGDCDFTEDPPVNDPPCNEEQQAKWSSVEFCGAITSEEGPFSTCDADFSGIYENCLYDMCLTNGDLNTLSQIMSEAAELCGDQLTCDWRQEVPSVANMYQCPDNAFYSGCAPGCQDTCFDPLASTRCNRPTQEGCVCKLGFVFHEGKCVRQQECGCFTQDYGYLPRGAVRSNEGCTRRCTCVGANNFVCEDYSCVDGEQCLQTQETFRCIVPAERCMIWGGYVKQFDGFRFNTDRVGNFIVVRSAGTKDFSPFVVRVNTGLEHPTSGIRTNRITVRYQHEGELVVARIRPGSKIVTVDGARLLPGSNYKGVRVLQQGFFSVLVFQFGGLVVRGSYLQGVVISAGGLLRGEIDGLCGSWNGDDSDDQNINDLLQNMFDDDDDEDEDKPPQSPEQPQSPEEPQQCANDRFLDFIRGPHSCGLLRSDLLKACNDLIPVDVRYEQCVSAIQCYNNYLPTLEGALIGHITECVMETDEPPVVPIRDQTGIAYVCPENSHYVASMTSCPRTCLDPEGTICQDNMGLQRFIGAEGCECDEGYLWSGYKCVKEEVCGCRAPDGVYHQHGDCYTGEGCATRCQCRSGVWDCEDFKCYKHQTCVVRQGHHECVATDRCKRNNGGCSDKCYWNAETNEVTCSCSGQAVIGPDLKTCVQIADADELIARYASDLAKWRESYKEWKAAFDNWTGTNGVTGRSNRPVWSLEGEVLGTATGTTCGSAPKCSVRWTQWFNSDTPDGCGDEETLERLRDTFDDVCNVIIAMEKRVEKQAVCVEGVDVDEIVLRKDSIEEGLFCDNSDQPLGVRCPDYSVRFLCVADVTIADYN